LFLNRNFFTGATCLQKSRIS